MSVALRWCAVLALVLAGAACSSSDDSDGSAPPGGSDSGTATTAASDSEDGSSDSEDSSGGSEDSAGGESSGAATATLTLDGEEYTFDTVECTFDQFDEGDLAVNADDASGNFVVMTSYVSPENDRNRSFDIRVDTYDYSPFLADAQDTFEADTGGDENVVTATVGGYEGEPTGDIITKDAELVFTC
ncbi:MAG: hypothetical protein ACR2JF_08025 [Iamia sp.]